MSIFSEPGTPVKPARPIGTGILPTDERQEEQDYDAMAAEAAALDALTRGLIPRDVAEWIASHRDGHPA